MKVSWDDDIPNISGKIKIMFQSPPTRHLFFPAFMSFPTSEGRHPRCVSPDALLENSANLGCDRYCLGTMSETNLTWCLLRSYRVSLPICEPWCWYIYLQNWAIFEVSVDTYSSTMEHMAYINSLLYHDFPGTSRLVIQLGRNCKICGALSKFCFHEAFPQGQHVLSMKGFNPPASVTRRSWCQLTQIFFPTMIRQVQWNTRLVELCWVAIFQWVDLNEHLNRKP